MPNLNFYVPTGRFGIVPAGHLNFGTDGLATCVGVIMQLNNNTILCGHMDHSYEPTSANKDAFKAQVTVLLNGVIPQGAAATAVYYATPGGTMAAAYTVQAITTLYANAVNAGTGMCLYMDATGVHSSNQSTTQGNQVNNGAFGV